MRADRTDGIWLASMSTQADRPNCGIAQWLFEAYSPGAGGTRARPAGAPCRYAPTPRQPRGAPFRDERFGATAGSSGPTPSKAGPVVRPWGDGVLLVDDGRQLKNCGVL